MAKTAKKAARKAAKTDAGSKAGKGTRYTDAVKQKVIAFVEEVNAAKGRGGVAAAARKFGVSPLSIGNWLRKGGVSSSGSRSKASGSGGGRNKVLSELVSLDTEIAKKRSELEKLEARFEKLKGSL